MTLAVKITFKDLRIQDKLTLYLTGQQLQPVLFIHRVGFVNCISHCFIKLKLLNKAIIGTKGKIPITLNGSLCVSGKLPTSPPLTQHKPGLETNGSQLVTD